MMKELYWYDCMQSLTLARDLYARSGELLGDDDTMQGITRITDLGQELAQQMTGMDFGKVCTVCAAKPNGGCCSRFMANENDAIQLLMNLLAGVKVEISQDNDQNCCFLGSCGCSLTFKPFFCLNYDCTGLKNSCAGEDMFRYERLRGLLLQEQWGLEQHLLQRLKTIGLVW